MTPPVADISAEEPLSNTVSYGMYDPQTTADYPINYTEVDWDLGTVNEEFENTWSSNHYRFGPTINWHTRNTTDSTLIRWEDEIGIGEYVDFRVEIPYNALGGQTPAGVYLSGQYYNMSQMKEGDFYQESNSPITWMVYYSIVHDRWLLYSSTNATWPEGPPGELPENFTLADVFGDEVNAFAELDIAHTGYIAGAESYWANIRLRFNSSTIGGFYIVGCGVQDEYFNSLAESRFEEFKSGRIIGTTFDFLVNQAVGGYYEWERVSDDGATLYSVTRGVDFNMTATITNGTILSNVTILFDVPDIIETEKWVYGPYTVTEEVTGVWEFDNVTETYWWNAAKTVNWTTTKEGYHFEDGYSYVDTSKEYNFWDGGSTYVHRAWGRAAVVYNVSTELFTNMLAYEYENYTWVDDEWGGHWEWIQWTEYEPWPTGDSIPLPFILNETTSGSYWDNGKYVVTFRGYMSDEILPTTSAEAYPIHLNEKVTDIYGRDLAPIAYLPLSAPELAVEYEQTHTFAIESPVSIVTLTHEGESYQPDWMFQTDIAEPFKVKSLLQGGVDYIENIDGVGFFMYASKDSWGFDGLNDWNQRSEVEIQIRIDPHGVVDVDIYNRTVRTQWSYGEHWDWVMVEVMPGRWEPQWTRIEDWYWEEMTWDFVANDWTPGWISEGSPSLKMNVHWLDVINVMQDIIGNDLRIVFDIVPTPELPQMEWQWEYYYGELTWVVDYDSGWGEHTILGWNQDSVYSYQTGTKLYMDEPIKAEIFKNNQTGDLYQREKLPFVEIDGEIINLKPYVTTDLETTWKENVRSEFNHETGEEAYFIKFQNGTEIQIFSKTAAVIYNVSLPMQDGLWFLSWCEYTTYTGTDDIHAMLAINGTWITGEWGPFWDMYTTTVYDVTDASIVEHTYVTYANGTIPIYMKGWPEYVGPDHYVMYLNGTYQPVDFWWNDMWGYYYWNNSVLNLIEWPWELVTGVYNSEPFFIPHYMTSSYVYTVVNDIEYQLPAPGIPMWSPWELNNLESIYDFANDRYFAKEFAIVNGTAYEAVLLPGKAWEPTYGYEYDVYQIDTGTLYNLTDWSLDPMYTFNYDYGDYQSNLPWTTVANGTIWVGNVVREDWTVAYGHRDPVTYDFVNDGWLDLRTGFYDGDYYSSRIHEWDDGRGYDWVETIGGEEFMYNKTWRATFLNITLSNGTFFYSRMDQPIPEPTDMYDWEIDRYYMIDIYGNYQGWQGWMDYSTELIFVEDVLGDPYGSGQFFWEGMYRPVIQYSVDYWNWDGYSWYNVTYFEDNIVPHDYFYLQSILNGSRYEIIELQNTPESYKWNFPSWAFNVSGTEYHARGRQEIIYEAFRTEGYGMKLDYAPLDITTIRTQGAIVYGTPAQGMWDVQTWTIDPVSGALDLDGNLDTDSDQFYVREIHSSTDIFNITQQYLDVSILWEPDNATWDDEFFLHSYTGMVTTNWTYDWSELNVWTHTDGSYLTPSEFDTLNATLFDEYGNPRPGYWGISWMFENRTYADVIQQAQDEGWDWVEDNTQEWSWLWWELDEHYSTEVSNGTHTDLMDVNLAYQYAGMFAWNDTSGDNFMNISSESLGDAELTHYWMPVDVDSVVFTTPGEAWGNLNTNDSEYRPVDETIDFGVTFHNVTGEVYPFGERSYFDWYEGAVVGSEFRDFDERPSECLTEDFRIDVHFTGIVNATGSNIAEVKFDLGVGDWDVDFPSSDNPLEGMSLAVAFYSDLNIFTSGGLTANASYINDDGEVVTNDQEDASLNFTMASGLSNVAMMGLGGSPYVWSFNKSLPTTVTAQTVPLSTFSEIYTSGGGNSATTFSISSQQFYTVIGFKWWDGFNVTVDPVFVGYISHGTVDTEAPQFGSVTATPTTVGSDDAAHIEAAVTDDGGSDIAEVKVWDSDNNVNYTMTYNDLSEVYEVDITRDPAHQESYQFNYTIVARDNAGNEAQTTSRVFVFRDNIDPVLGTLSFDNSTDGYGNEIAIISVTASDTGGSGLSSVVLTYSNSSGDFDVSMSLDSGSYVDTIPNHAPGTTVDYWVTATDGDDNTAVSSTEQFTFATGGAPDTSGPSLASIGHDPSSPTPSDTVTVSVNVYDTTGVDHVTLQYKIGSGTWTNVSMSASGDTYSGDIPSQVDSTLVTYRIVAYDTLGYETISSEFSYTVTQPTTTTTTATTTTTTTTTSTGTTTGQTDPQTMLLMLGGVGGIILIVVILVVVRRRS